MTNQHSTTGERERLADLVGDVSVNRGMDVAGIIRHGSPSADVREILLDVVDVVLSADSRPSRMAASSEGEPVAWMFEYLCENGTDEPSWEPGASRLNPAKWTAFQYRNVRPLYAHPAMFAARPDAGREAPLLDKSGLENREVIDHPDAYLGAALDFSRSILAHCMASGLKARDLADGFQHLESAIRGLHARALRATSTPPVAVPVSEEAYRVGDFIGRHPVLCIHGSTDPNNLCPLCEDYEPERRLAVPDKGVQGDQGAKAREFIENWFSPWGSWKTAWWEMVVSDDVEMSDANALRALQNILAQASEGGAS